MMSSGGAKLGCPNLWREASQKIAFKSVGGLWCWQWKVRRKELPRRQSAPPKFFDVIVWEVVFPMIEKMGVPDSVWKLHVSFVFLLKRFFRQG